jgi:phosphoribosyl 1,2-cyclic phosphodiesterase
MSLFIASLNSGSNGNCYYAGNHNEAVLVDAGLSCRETEIRMARLGLSMERVKAIFISHEHSDHISGLQVLAKKYRLPVYISAATLRNSGMVLPQELVRHISAESISIGALRITAFEKFHDAADPYSFIIEASGVKIGVLTDIGKVCKQVVHYFRQCHAVFLESNYDERMLAQGGYPLHLQKRIRGGMGHLSNVQAFQLFKAHRSPSMSHLILSHLSKNNNHPEKALDLFRPYADELTIAVASRHCESAAYHVQHPAESFSSHRNLMPFRSVQYSLFE